MVAPLTGLGPKIRHYHQPFLLFNCYKYVNFLKCPHLPYFGAFPSFIEKPNKEVRKAEQIGLNVGECLASRWCRFGWWWDLRATPWDTLVGNSAGSVQGPARHRSRSVQGPAKHRSRSRLQSIFKSSFSCHLSIPLLENLSIIMSKAQLLVAGALGSRSRPTKSKSGLIFRLSFAANWKSFFNNNDLWGSIREAFN